MQISRLMSYAPTRTTFFNQTKAANPISFGEEHWAGGGPDYQGMQNKRVETFFENAAKFKENADYDIKHIDKLAQKAFAKGKKTDFKSAENDTVKMNGITYDIKCTKVGSTKMAVLKNGSEIFRFYFGLNSKDTPKEYLAKCENDHGKYTLDINEDGQTYTEVLKRGYGTRILTYNKQGYTYTEKTDESSKDYNRAIVKKFPHEAESQYIEFVTHHFSDDTTCVYSRDSKTKDWIYSYK